MLGVFAFSPSLYGQIVATDIVPGLLFLFQTSVTQTFQADYGFSVFQTSLVQLALSAGAVIATCINPIQDHYYLTSAKCNKETPGKPIPEARLYSSVPGSIIFTAGLFWYEDLHTLINLPTDLLHHRYGWSSYPHVHWIVPTMGVACVGFGIYSIYLAVVNYFADAYERYAASALSAASLGRNTFGAFLPLAAPALYRNLGFQWASSLLGFLAAALSTVPIILLLKGPEIRRRSPFMSESSFDDEGPEERQNSRPDDTSVGRQGGNPSTSGQAIAASASV